MLHAEDVYKPSSRDVKAAERRVILQHLPSVQAHTLGLRREETLGLLNGGQHCTIMAPVQNTAPEFLGKHLIAAGYECREWTSISLSREVCSGKWRVVRQLSNGILLLRDEHETGKIQVGRRAERTNHWSPNSRISL